MEIALVGHCAVVTKQRSDLSIDSNMTFLNQRHAAWRRQLFKPHELETRVEEPRRSSAKPAAPAHSQILAL